MNNFLDEITKFFTKTQKSQNFQKKENFFTNTLEDTKLIDSTKIPTKLEISNDVFSIENSVKKTIDFSSCITEQIPQSTNIQWSKQSAFVPLIKDDLQNNNFYLNKKRKIINYLSLKKESILPNYEITQEESELEEKSICKYTKENQSKSYTKSEIKNLKNEIIEKRKIINDKIIELEMYSKITDSKLNYSQRKNLLEQFYKTKAKKDYSFTLKFDNKLKFDELYQKTEINYHQINVGNTTTKAKPVSILLKDNYSIKPNSSLYMKQLYKKIT